uniref:Uncharacterized protein n=1 Tax=Solanum tuberosum TaxID=4113 RepID=M1CM25_SOLTU
MGGVSSCRRQLIDRRGIELIYQKLNSFKEVRIVGFQVRRIQSCVQVFGSLVYEIICDNINVLKLYPGRDMDLLELSAYGNVRHGQDSGGCKIQ